GATSKAINFQAEIWVDNWFALYINGKQVRQDSVPITTERSFNSEKIRFTATYPFTVGLILKDFTENSSGLEYIGKPNQQIGDGGAIAQIRDLSTNQIVLTTDGTWKSLVINKAPLNPECVTSQNPVADCKYANTSIPKSWSTNSFNDSTWKSVSTYTKDAVGVKEGAALYQPDCVLPAKGFYFRPTVFSGVSMSHRIAREEIFGPVLSVLTFRTVDEAIEKANNTAYGLSAGVWTDKGSRILKLAAELKAGVVWANTYNKFDPASPFGGYKESGFGREGGRQGLLDYCQFV
ncbi:MAG: aldehyde dehydrogenase family protein, partial [Opitutaceae bacterium]|nr:aldehyde dehydrogenase family protein [Opitutaceae bacterium]